MDAYSNTVYIAGVIERGTKAITKPHIRVRTITIYKMLSRVTDGSSTAVKCPYM